MGPYFFLTYCTLEAHIFKSTVIMSRKAVTEKIGFHTATIPQRLKKHAKALEDSLQNWWNLACAENLQNEVQYPVIAGGHLIEPV